MLNMERRFYKVELRMDGEGDSKKMRGVAAVVNKLSDDLGWFRERIIPGAFTATLSKSPDVRALFNHDVNMVLGRTASGTLSLSETDQGLEYEIDLPDTTLGRDLRELVRRGDVSQSSFGFYVLGSRWVEEGGEHVRELTEIEMDGGDVSPVTYPAYPQTSVEARSKALWPTGMPEDLKQAIETAKGGGNIWEIESASRARDLRLKEMQMSAGSY